MKRSTIEARVQQLTARQRTILTLIGQGMSNRQIADGTSLTEKTVKNYVTAILTRLCVHNRTQAALALAEARIQEANRRADDVLDELKAARAECAELRRTIRNLHELREEAHECNGRHWVEADENAVVDL